MIFMKSCTVYYVKMGLHFDLYLCVSLTIKADVGVENEQNEQHK